MVAHADKCSVLLIAILALASAVAQTTAGGKPIHRTADKRLVTAPGQATKPDAAEQVKIPDPAPIPSMSLEELPAKTPQVSYRNGELVVEAGNATLGEVLNAIGKAMGAQIEKPPTADSERVAAHLSGPPRRVITELLNDSKFGYIILCPPEDPAGIQKLVLMAQTEGDARPSATPTVQSGTRRALTSSQPVDPQSEPGPTPQYPSSADEDVAKSATRTSTFAAQITPDAVLQENMAHAASQMTAATAALNAAKAADQKPSSAAPATETETPSSAPGDATQSSPDSTAVQQAADKTPMQVLQDLFEMRRQLQQQQNQAQKSQQDQ